MNLRRDSQKHNEPKTQEERFRILFLKQWGMVYTERFNIKMEEIVNGRKLRYSILNSIIEVVKPVGLKIVLISSKQK